MGIPGDLVTAARAGDHQAWEQLYRGIHRRLRGYVARRVGDEHVEDVMDEIMERAVAGLDRSDVGSAGFDAWVFGIARRSVFEHTRRVATARRHAPEVPAGIHLTVDDIQARDFVVLDDELEQVLQVFAGLPPDEQEQLELQVVAGLNAAEAARLFGKRSRVAHTTASRADVAFLDTLAIVLEPPAVEPTASALFSLRMAVSAHHAGL